MKRWPGMVALIVAVAGLGVMLLPTMEMHWGVDPSLGVGSAGLEALLVRPDSSRLRPL